MGDEATIEDIISEIHANVVSYTMQVIINESYCLNRVLYEMLL